MDVSSLISLPPSCFRLTLQSQDTDRTHFKRTEEDFNGLSVLLWNLWYQGRIVLICQLAFSQPGEIIRRPQSEYLILYLWRNAAETQGLIWRDLWALFSPSAVEGNSHFVFGLHQNTANLEFLSAKALLNKSIVFGKISYETLYFYIFWLQKGTLQISNINTNNQNVYTYPQIEKWKSQNVHTYPNGVYLFWHLNLTILY